eukprot:TRINITY_DN5188_c0_g2_i1.p1 TRINITY_DN5188_c0_g2~~TRINITY_DN5188_c0_g2_i1.p1  ORF type:complete len:462 (-),score=73.44 TRINITY_DN5188_c0_g2_i1:86-1327(-)
MSELPVTFLYGIIQKSGKLLQTLTLRDCRWLNDEMLLKFTTFCPKIQSLEIPGCLALTGPGIIAALQHSWARTLDISECKLTALQLKTIAEKGSLHTLIANQCNWGDASFKRIKEIPNLQKLYIISKSNIGSTCNYRKIFPNLTDLELCLPISIETLKELHMWKNLKRIWIKSPLEKNESIDIKGLGQCPRLEVVSVSNPQHVDAIFHPKIKHLQLSHSNFNQTQSKSFLQMSNLVTLELKHVDIDLLSIFQMESLKNLTLHNCDVVSQSLQSSSTISKLTFLSIILDFPNLMGSDKKFHDHLEPMAKHTSHLTSFHILCRSSGRITIPDHHIDMFLASNPITELTLDYPNAESYFTQMNRRPMTLALAAGSNPDPTIFSVAHRKHDHLPDVHLYYYAYTSLWRGTIVEADKS